MDCFIWYLVFDWIIIQSQFRPLSFEITYRLSTQIRFRKYKFEWIQVTIRLVFVHKIKSLRSIKYSTLGCGKPLKWVANAMVYAPISSNMMKSSTSNRGNRTFLQTYQSKFNAIFNFETNSFNWTEHDYLIMWITSWAPNSTIKKLLIRWFQRNWIKMYVGM